MIFLHGSAKFDIHAVMSPEVFIDIPGCTIKIIIPVLIRISDDQVSMDGNWPLSIIADSNEVHNGSPVFNICVIVDPMNPMEQLVSNTPDSKI